MIQRIQTLFMLLALTTMALFLAFPLIIWEYPVQPFEALGWQISTYVSPYRYYLTAILTGTAASFTLLAVFLYKRRSLQMGLLGISMMFMLSAAAFVVWRFQTDRFEGYLQLTYWNLMAAATLLFQLLAVFYIRKDEKLIRSLDRMR